MRKLLLVAQYLFKPWLSYYDERIFGTAVVTLDCDLGLWPWTLKSQRWKSAEMLSIGAKFHENRTCNYQAITNKWTDQPTNTPDHNTSRWRQ